MAKDVKDVDTAYNMLIASDTLTLRIHSSSKKSKLMATDSKISLMTGSQIVWPNNKVLNKKRGI